jgi:hypothetical protein
LVLSGKTTSAPVAVSRRRDTGAIVSLKREGTLGIGTHHRSTESGARPRVAAALAWTACLLVVAALLGACSAQATTGGVPATGVTTGSSSGGAAPAAAGGGNDWAHVLQVVANLKAQPPAEPVVVLFGGSAARESTISDSSWRSQIKAKGGGATIAYNLASRNRTLAQNVALVQALPKVPTIVYIGINLGVFTSAQKTATISLPKPVTPLPAYKQHSYSQSKILSVAKKKALLRDWLAKRYPVFKRNYATSAGVLEKLVKVCRQSGMRPVLFELPRNTAIIGHQLDAPVSRYRKTCQALAKNYDIPYVSFVAQAKLPNSRFYDLWHLVEPGRSVWQGLLSAKTVELLKKYDMVGGATP